MDLRATYANCLIGGDDFIEVVLPEGPWKVCNHIRLSLGAFEVDLFQRPEVIRNLPSTFVGRAVETTDVLIRNVSPPDEDSARETVTGLAWLLGFLSGSAVRPVSTQYNGVTQRQGVRGVAAYFRPVGEVRDGTWVKSAVESMWSGFQRNKGPRQLIAVFDYLATSDVPEQPIEVRLLLSFVVLENLKATYAQEAGIPYIGGYFRRISTPPKANPMKEPRWLFAELLDAMLKAVGMSGVPAATINLRNEIVHFGLSVHPASELVKELLATRALIQEYILRLTGFHGEYFDYATHEVKTIA